MEPSIYVAGLNCSSSAVPVFTTKLVKVGGNILKYPPGYICIFRFSNKVTILITSSTMQFLRIELVSMVNVMQKCRLLDSYAKCASELTA